MIDKDANKGKQEKTILPADFMIFTEVESSRTLVSNPGLGCLFSYFPDQWTNIHQINCQSTFSRHRKQ